MSLQDTYTETPALGAVGAIADTRHRVLTSRTIEGDDGDVVPFGAPLARGDGDYSARATAAGDTADDLVGIAIRDQTLFTEGFATGDTARVGTTVTVWVKTTTAVAAGDPVHVIVADGTYANTGGVVFPGAQFDDTGAADALVRIRLD